MKLLHKLDDKFTGIGIRNVRGVACLFSCLATLFYIQQSRMGIPYSEYLIVLYGTVAIVEFILFKTTPKGIPTRADIEKENNRSLDNA